MGLTHTLIQNEMCTLMRILEISHVIADVYFIYSVFIYLVFQSFFGILSFRIATKKWKIIFIIGPDKDNNNIIIRAQILMT